MAHENTKLWLGGDFFVEWENRHHTPRPAAELPNKTFYKSGKLDFGGRRVEYWYVPRAHTDGDVAVFFRRRERARRERSAVRRPLSRARLRDGRLDRRARRRVAKAARRDGRATRASWPPTAASTAAPSSRRSTRCARPCGSKPREAFRAGMSLADFVASKPTAAFDERWGDPRQFLPLVYKGGFAHLRELGGVDLMRLRAASRRSRSRRGRRARRGCVLAGRITTRRRAPPSSGRCSREYCIDCHNRDDFTAEIAFDRMSAESIAHEPEIFEAVVRKLRGAQMPPPGAPQPDQRDAPRLDRRARGRRSMLRPSRQPNPGQIALHRLNRTEYANAIADLLALESTSKRCCRRTTRATASTTSRTC